MLLCTDLQIDDVRQLGREGPHVGVFVALVPEGAQAPGLVVALDGARSFSMALVACPQLQQRLVAALQGRQLLLRCRQLLAAAAQAGFCVLQGRLRAAISKLTVLPCQIAFQETNPQLTTSRLLSGVSTKPHAEEGYL